MNKDDSKEEITVKAPSKPITPPKDKTEKDKERALEEERFGVFQISKKIGLYFGSFAAIFGLILLILSSLTAWTFFSNEPKEIAIILWILASLTTIISGFLLMGSD